MSRSMNGGGGKSKLNEKKQLKTIGTYGAVKPLWIIAFHPHPPPPGSPAKKKCKSLGNKPVSHPSPFTPRGWGGTTTKQWSGPPHLGLVSNREGALGKRGGATSNSKYNLRRSLAAIHTCRLQRLRHRGVHNGSGGGLAGLAGGGAANGQAPIWTALFVIAFVIVIVVPGCDCLWIAVDWLCCPKLQPYVVKNWKWGFGTFFLMSCKIYKIYLNLRWSLPHFRVLLLGFRNPEVVNHYKKKTTHSCHGGGDTLIVLCHEFWFLSLNNCSHHNLTKCRPKLVRRLRGLPPVLLRAQKHRQRM